MNKLLATVIISLSVISVYAEEQKQETNMDNTRIDKAMDFFKAYVYVPSTKIITNNILDKLDLKDLVKLLDSRIHSVVNDILTLNKEASEIYSKQISSTNGDRDKIRELYIQMASIYESLRIVDYRVKILYPEPHMTKLFEVLQKIYNKQYQITYNPEEDKKSFWDVFTGK